MAREGILPQHALDQHREPIDALADVDNGGFGMSAIEGGADLTRMSAHFRF